VFTDEKRRKEGAGTAVQGETKIKVGASYRHYMSVSIKKFVAVWYGKVDPVIK
jgi:hypothetical protein